MDFKIQIVVSEDNGGITIKVIDNGVGVSPDYVEKLFKYFDGIKVRWGLALNKELLGLINGQIEHQNNSGAEGCTFTIILKHTQLLSKLY